MKKKFLLFVLLCCLTEKSGAQVHSKNGYLIISVCNVNDYVVEKGTWSVKILALKYHILTTSAFEQQEKILQIPNSELQKRGHYEKMVLGILKPYFDQGWRLISVSMDQNTEVNGGGSINAMGASVATGVTSSSTQTERYFLSK